MNRNITVPPLVSCISMCTRSGSTSTPDTDLEHRGLSHDQLLWIPSEIRHNTTQHQLQIRYVYKWAHIRKMASCRMSLFQLIFRSILNITVFIWGIKKIFFKSNAQWLNHRSQLSVYVLYPLILFQIESSVNMPSSALLGKCTQMYSAWPSTPENLPKCL